MQLLELFRVAPTSRLAILSEQLALQLIGDRARGSQIHFNRQLHGQVVLFPLYRGRVLDHNAKPLSTRSRLGLSEARASLICLLATLRAGGVAAPVTPELLRPEKDILGRELPPEVSSWPLPAILQQWRPGLVITFGPLHDVFFRMSRPRGLWASPMSMDHLHLTFDAPAPEESSGLPIHGGFLDRAVDSAEVAVELPCGHLLTYGALAAAVHDPAAPPPASTVEGALVTAVRAATAAATSVAGATGGTAQYVEWPGDRPQGRSARIPWWAAEEAGAATLQWPPRKLLPREDDPWTPVVDIATGGTYYWDQNTNETSWERPTRGRRSAPRASGMASEHAARLAEARMHRVASPMPARSHRRRGGAPEDPEAVGQRSGARLGAALSATRGAGRASEATRAWFCDDGLALMRLRTPVLTPVAETEDYPRQRPPRGITSLAE